MVQWSEAKMTTNTLLHMIQIVMRGGKKSPHTRGEKSPFKVTYFLKQ